LILFYFIHYFNEKCGNQVATHEKFCGNCGSNNMAFGKEVAPEPVKPTS